MPTLAGELRSKLERVVIDARDMAEAGARAALEALAVHHYELYPHMKPAQRELRNHLRARARQVGDRKLPKPDSSGKDHEIDHLVGECAYEHWHRMLFARFLAENGLLIEPQENMAISLAEAEELAKEGGVDVWVFASRCAQRMLPQIFRPDDPLLQVSFATEHMLKLEKLLASLPQVVFTASDALGWVYQFWQSKKKDEVNRSEVKIGADEIAAVTQLFTEPYMVEFLLHNTIGAWWAGKKLAAKDAASAKTEEELRKKLALPGVGWEYLRFVRGAAGKGSPWRPAAGTFDGWPRTAAELKVLDPCCGSGHFLVAGLHHLVPMRMAEEGLSAAQAVDAVLHDNLHGLEIDERCCQIAAFALAFAAWTYPGAGGHRPLPDLHIACTGIGPQSTQEQWLKLAEQSGVPIPAIGRQAINNGLLNLHRLFSQAPILGSLINPAQLPADLVAADYKTIRPYLAAIMSAEKADDETRERAIAVAGMVRAAELLAKPYTLVITNVPYLGSRRQCAALLDYGATKCPLAKSDLGVMFLSRCIELAATGGTAAVVMSQYWLFKSSYEDFRRDRLRLVQWDIVGRLGPRAFETISGEVVNVCVGVWTNLSAHPSHQIGGVDAVKSPGPATKAQILMGGDVVLLSQVAQLANPGARIILGEVAEIPLLQDLVVVPQGVKTGDDERWRRRFWEIPDITDGWIRYQSTVSEHIPYGGRSLVLDWRSAGDGMVRPRVANVAVGRRGVAISQSGDLAATLYTGERFDSNVAPIVPHDETLIPAIWTYCTSREYVQAVRAIDQSLKVTNVPLVQVPFDVEHWQMKAEQMGKFPEPDSPDPTQWVHRGVVTGCSEPLQVAVAKLVGYQWPDQLKGESHARGGIACIPSVRGEEPAAERLLVLLRAEGVEPGKVREMAGADLEEWLRKSFFDEHCKLFHDRPFVWHIWDGRKHDGFHALVNYHKLCEGQGKGRKLLESLTYAYLGEWITRQKDGVQRGEGGAEDRLAAAQELQKRLEAILAGGPPFDLFVRWKPLAEQAIGWEPDINDGVRMNIRPFLASDLPTGRNGAGVLRWRPSITWTKDRGKEPDRPKVEFPWFWGWDEKTEDFMGGKGFDGNRHNDCHYSNKAKQAARDAANTTKGNK